MLWRKVSGAGGTIGGASGPTLVGVNVKRDDGALSMTINIPSGTVDGDKMILAIVSRFDNSNTPSGWTTFESGNLFSQVYFRACQRTASSEGSSVTVTLGSSASNYFCVLIWSVTGWGSYDTGTAARDLEAFHTASAITPSSDGLAFTYYIMGGSTSISSSPSGWTAEETSLAGSASAGYLYSKAASSGVSTGSATINHPNNTFCQAQQLVFY